MQELEAGQRAFSTFRVLNGDANIVERDQLFRNMARLFSYVSDRCDDEQVAQYDEVLCQLAELVEVEARGHVARLLAPLARAPGTVVVKLANDDAIEVAQPLLEFSNVLSDDDLIEIAATKSEEHRVAIAGRAHVAERVGDAILEHGGRSSASQLVRNANAELGRKAIEDLMQRARDDAEITADLRGRTDIDWPSLREAIDSVGRQVLDRIIGQQKPIDPEVAGKINAVVYNRMRNRAGFSSQSWTVAYNQVKALSDRKQLDEGALIRFARFGYGHHIAAALTVVLGVPPQVVVKWLASQDYAAVMVALKHLDISPALFDAMVAAMPWRDLPTEEDREQLRRRYEALAQAEAEDIFGLWRAHAFRRRQPAEQAPGPA